MKSKSLLLKIFILCLFLIMGNSCGHKKNKKNDKSDFSKKPLKVAFIYAGPIGDAGWTYSHDCARKELERNYPSLEAEYYESVPEDEKAEKLVRKLAKEGCKVIFATSYGYKDVILKVAKDFPDTVFLQCSGKKISSNTGTYFGKIYQARFLTGLIAGKMTKTNKIGYIAALDIPEVKRGINAFTLGVRKVNPKARVYVYYTKTWHNASLERKAANFLFDYGCDVLNLHQDSITPVLTAQERKKFCIGYHTDMSIFSPRTHLVSAVWNWYVFYDEVIKSVYQGTWKPSRYWKGIKEGIVDISPPGENLPSNVRTLAEKFKNDMIADKFFVFEGPIKDVKGKIIISKGEKPDDENLWNIDFYVDGVVVIDKTKKKAMKKYIKKQNKGKGKIKQVR